MNTMLTLNSPIPTPELTDDVLRGLEDALSARERELNAAIASGADPDSEYLADVLSGLRAAQIWFRSICVLDHQARVRAES
jgi:hypothetical protein